MESVQTTQNTFTENEKRLAAKYQVEPKLVRLLKEIVEEHFAEPEPEPEQVETQEQPKQEENRPNTGITALDRYIKEMSIEAKVAVYGTMELMCICNETGDKIRGYLRREVMVFDDPSGVEKQTCMDYQTWAECTWYLGFVKGAELGQQED